MYKNPSGDPHPGWGRSNLYGKDPENFMAYELLSILNFAVMVWPALIKTKSLTPVFQLATALFLLIHGLFATIAPPFGGKGFPDPKKHLNYDVLICMLREFLVSESL